MQSTQNKSKVKVFVAALITVAVLVILGGAAFAFVQITSQSDKNATEQTNGSAETESKTVTQQSMQQSVSDIDESIKQTKSAHEDATKAVENLSKPVKVSQ